MKYERRIVYKAAVEAVDSALREGFDGLYLKDGIAERLLRLFEVDTLRWVLANTIQQKDHDGRFSNSNKVWAGGYPIERDRDNVYLICETHSTILNGFVHTFREVIGE